MNTIPEITEAIRKLSTTAEINAVITAVKAQQKLIRRMESAKAAMTLEIGQNVKVNARNRVITGTIKKINRSKAVVDAADGLYNVPLTMLQAA